MAPQLLPPPELSPPVPSGLPPEHYISAWFDLMDTCEQFVLAGLRERIGPDGDLKAAYVEWYWQQMEEHDRTILHMMEEFDRRSRKVQEGDRDGHRPATEKAGSDGCTRSKPLGNL